LTKTIPAKRWNLYDYEPNGWAMDHVHSREERFIVGTTARQVGKTTTAAMLIDEEMNAGPDLFGNAPVVGVLAPTYDKAELSVRKYVDYLTRAFGPDSYTQNWNAHRIRLPNGAELQWLSSDDPYSVVGYTFSALIVDEAQSVPDIVWEKIYPALDVRQARVYCFGTPDITPNQSWYRSLYIWGQDPDREGYHSYNVTCFENKWMSLEAILLAQQTLSSREFRMLYLGEWVDEEGSVFTNIEPALMHFEPEFEDGKRYRMAVDFAIHEDFNVVIVAEENTRSCVYMERWNRTDPFKTYDRIETIYHDWGRPTVIGDAQGMGEPMLAELRQRGMSVRPFKLTAANKMQVVQKLAGDLEHRRIMFPATWKMLIQELKAYVYHMTPGGFVTAQAAAGYHDDTVMALAMLNQGLKPLGRSVNDSQYNYKSVERYGLINAR
jgi:hypothetical protein